MNEGFVDGWMHVLQDAGQEILEHTIIVAVKEDLIELISVPVVGGRSHRDKVRSKPGEPPRTDSGELIDSISIETSRAGDLVTATLVISARHAVWLENGVPGRMAARPFIKPIIEKWEVLAAEEVEQGFVIRLA
jgi:hypothetical protein